MRTITLLAMLSLTACAGYPLAEDSGVSQLTVRELSALEGIPGGYVPTQGRNHVNRGAEMTLVPAVDGPGLTARETVALESVYGSYGPIDERDEVRRGDDLSLVATTRSSLVEARTISAIDGIPRSAFGF